MSRNYQLVYYVAQKCVNYRDTGVSKNTYTIYYEIDNNSIRL